MTTAEEIIIDDYFEGYIDEYEQDVLGSFKEAERQIRLQKARYKDIVTKFFGAYDAGLTWRFDKVDHIYWDIGQALRLIVQGQRIDKDEVFDLLDVLHTGIDNILKQINIFEVIVLCGLAKSIGDFSLIVSISLTTEAKKSLAALKVLLENAKKQKNEARVQFVLDKALVVVELFLPEIYIVETVFRLGKLGYDKLLGPDGPGNYDKVKASSELLISTGFEVDRINKSAQPVFKSVLTKIEIMEQAIDIVGESEYDKAKRNVRILEAQIKNTQEKLKYWIANMNDVQMKVIRLNTALKRNRRLFKESQEEVYDNWFEFDETLKDVKYSSPKIWKRV